jgi:hypothetical protein
MRAREMSADIWLLVAQQTKLAIVILQLLNFISSYSPLNFLHIYCQEFQLLAHTMSSVEHSELPSPEVSNNAGEEEISDDSDDDEADSSASSEGSTSHEPPSWLLEKLRASKYCTSCQVFLDDWSGILSGEPCEGFGEFKSTK